jgi:4-amino-4-deoxy-L-arabinose transferase-like glycosyltransferase
VVAVVGVAAVVAVGAVAAAAAAAVAVADFYGRKALWLLASLPGKYTNSIAFCCCLLCAAAAYISTSPLVTPAKSKPAGKTFPVAWSCGRVFLFPKLN